ncbi:MAG: hypothetical protein WDO74_10910 [Pseudomonadota bacterium]
MTLVIGTGESQEFRVSSNSCSRSVLNVQGPTNGATLSVRTQGVLGLDALRQRMDVLAAETASRNWNFENDEPIAPRSWEDAFELCKLARAHALAPEVSPCGDGSIHLYWTCGSKRLTIEVKEGEFYWSSRSSEGRSHSDGSVDLRAAADKVAELFN